MDKIGLGQLYSVNAAAAAMQAAMQQHHAAAQAQQQQQAAAVAAAAAAAQQQAVASQVTGLPQEHHYRTALRLLPKRSAFCRRAG